MTYYGPGGASRRGSCSGRSRQAKNKPASLLLVAMPGAPSSFLFLIAMASNLVESDRSVRSDALCS